MATTFDVIYLGVQARFDKAEGNTVAENGNALEGVTIGGAADPLFGNVQTLSPGSTGYSGGNIASAYDQSGPVDTFSINGGADQTYDMGMAYSAVLTYADGTAAKITAIVFQDTDGNTYLGPQLSYNATQAAMETKPIQSITLDIAVFTGSGGDEGFGLTADRYDATFATPGSVDGTAEDDVMGVGHVDADGDIIDGADGIDDTIYGYDGNDTIYGGAGNDTIGGWSEEGGNDEIHAGDGNDSVIAGAGNDTVYGGAGDDYLTGAQGTDRLYGETGDDVISVTDDHEIVYAFGGEESGDKDTLVFSNYVSTAGVTVAFSGNETGSFDFVATKGSGTFAEFEQVIGTGYDDTIDASASSAGQLLSGGSGDDSITGGTGSDVMSGDAGDDSFVFEAGFGKDEVTGGEKGEVAGDTLDASAVPAPLTVTFSGTDAGTLSDGANAVAFTEIENISLGAGNDFVSAMADGDGVGIDVGDGADTVWGGSGDDTVQGGAGDDWIQGNAGTNVLSGDAGDDTFEIVTSEGGSDKILGGETGETQGDTLVFTGSDGAKVVLSGNEDGSFTAGTASGEFTGIETVELTDQADTFDGTAATAGLTVDGGAGADMLVGGAGADMLTGGTGDDALQGNAGNDTIYGGAGNDTLTGGAGTDFLYSEAGDDVVYGGDDLDVIFAGQGNDTLYGESGDDIFIVDGSENSTTVIVGGETGETTGDTLILPGDGSATPGVKVSFSGDEAASFDDGTNAGSFVEIERLQTSGGDDRIDASATASGIDIYAGSGADVVWGGAGSDTIAGAGGDDTLAGGAGDDVVTGGYGLDTFAFSDGDGHDVITDFDLADDDGDGFTNDQLDLSNLTDSNGNPVNVWDVVVSDTVGDGSGDAILTFPNGESLTLTNVDPALLDTAMMQAMRIPCLVAGTLIDTPNGGQRVERLRPGDMVTTRGGGAAPVAWTASRRLDGAALAAQPGLRPVRIRAGALGNWRDLMVSPQHRMALGPRDAPTGFAPARWLAEDADGRFRIARGQRAVTYVHLLLPEHALIRAEGCWVESFYPGPQGLAALDPAARVALFERFPAFTGIRSKPDVKRAYGPLALREIRRRELVRFIDRPQRARPARPAGRQATPLRVSGS